MNYNMDKQTKQKRKKAIVSGLSGNIEPLKKHLHSDTPEIFVYERISENEIKISGNQHTRNYTNAEFEMLCLNSKKRTGREPALIRIKHIVISKKNGIVVSNIEGEPETNTPYEPNKNES